MRAKKCLLLLIIILVVPSMAETLYFSHAGIGSKWENTSIWNTGNLPTHGDDAMVFRPLPKSCVVDASTGTAAAANLYIGAGQGAALIEMRDGVLDVENNFMVGYTHNDGDSSFVMSGGQAHAENFWICNNAPNATVYLSGDAVLNIGHWVLFKNDSYMDISGNAKIIITGFQNLDQYINSGQLTGNGVVGNVEKTWDGTNTVYTAGELVPAPVYYVSPYGDDSNEGTLHNPFATIERARQSVRAFLAGNTVNSDIYVYIRGGNYYLDNTIAFDEMDSGQNGVDVVYTNYPNEKPVLIGGRKISGWTLDSGNIYKVYLGEVDTGNWLFDQIFENKTRSTLARFPNSGYLKAADGGNDPHTQLVFNYGDIPAWSDCSDAQIYVWPDHDWLPVNYPITSINYSSRQITMAGNSGYYSIHAGDRYYIKGIKQELDSPGEFYLNKETGWLYYWPMKTPVEQQEIVAPVLEKLISVAGSTENSPAHNIRFEGLHLYATKFKTSFQALNYNYRESIFYTRNSNNISIKNCKIYNSGMNGICLDTYSQNNTVYGNVIHDCGLHGILVRGYYPGYGVTDDISQAVYDNKQHLISNNHIYAAGENAGNGCGIYVYQSGENEISHNLIHDAARSGITMANGWPPIGSYVGNVLITEDNCWGLYMTRDNVLKYNHIHSVVKDSEDSGGITAWGVGKNNRLEYNRIHNICPPENIPYTHATGIYLDDFASYFTVKGNIIYDINTTAESSLITVKGQSNALNNNILIKNPSLKNAIWLIKNWSIPPSYGWHTITHNIIFCVSNGSGANFFDFVHSGNSYFLDSSVILSDYNLFYLDGSGTYYIPGIPGVDTLVNWKTLYNNKYDQNSLVANPLFVAQSVDDYRLLPSSPAYLLGFEEIDQNSIGLKSDFPDLVPSDTVGLSIIAEQWLMQFYNPVSDFNDDGIVDLADFAELASGWQK